MQKNIVIAVLVAIIAGGGALMAFADSPTITTTANVDVTVWEKKSDGTLYLSTRPEGGTWTTHNTALDRDASSSSGAFWQGSGVTVGVPVTVEIPPAEPGTTPPTQTPSTAWDLTDFGRWRPWSPDSDSDPDDGWHDAKGHHLAYQLLAHENRGDIGDIFLQCTSDIQPDGTTKYSNYGKVDGYQYVGGPGYRDVTYRYDGMAAVTVFWNHTKYNADLDEDFLKYVLSGNKEGARLRVFFSSGETVFIPYGLPAVLNALSGCWGDLLTDA